MTKREKIWLSGLIVFLAALLAVTAVVVVPLVREAQIVPVETTEFLPRPDSVVCFKDGQEIVLDEAQGQLIYDNFMKAMEHLEGADVGHWSLRDEKAFLDVREKELCVEFRYEQRYRFVGHVQGAWATSIKEPFDFDAIILIVKHSALFAVRKCARHYHNLEDFGEKIISPAMITFYSGYYEVKQAIAQAIGIDVTEIQ